MPLASPDQPMQGTGLTGGEVRPPEDPPDKGHRVLAFEWRVTNRIKVPVDMLVQVAHIDR